MWRLLSADNEAVWNPVELHSHVITGSLAILTTPTDASASFDNPASVLEYVLRLSPEISPVYPTETYYYFGCSLDDKQVRGNIRFLDASDGLLHIGYYSVTEPWDVRSASFGSAEGISVSVSEAASGSRVRVVSAAGTTRDFVLHGFGLLPQADLALLDHEEVVTGVLDESGVALTLLFNKAFKSFYFALNESVVRGDVFVPVRNTDLPLFVGRRTRFVVYRDPEYRRDLLIGVLAASVRRNDFFDGPFDQVPPRLPIKDKLVGAYPYVELQGGIDEHGNFLTQPGHRVAISPYYTYERLSDVVEFARAAVAGSFTASDRWARLAFDPKRDAHLSLPQPEDGADQ